MNKYMKAAINEAYKGIKAGHGGPFGAVIVKDGKIIARGHNHVVSNNDPTCHGEINAIRKACKKLKTFDLTGCDLYTSGEPCDMCLCASMWANIKHIYWACSIEDNGMIGFRDDKFGKIFDARSKLQDYLTCIDRDAGLKLFKDYLNMQHTLY